MSEGDKSRLKIAGGVAAVAAIAVVGMGIATRVHSERRLTSWTEAQAVPNVHVIHASSVATSDALRLPANLQALNAAPIYARTTGYVRRWLVDLGDPVRRGQVLAILDAPEVDQQLVAAQADLQTARANQALAATTATRWSAMLAKDAVSKQETDEKAGDLAAKSALTNAARANVARLRSLTGFTRLTAPFDGIVTSRATEIGALVVAGNASSTPLFTVADISRIRAYVKVPQAYSGQIHPGMAVALTLPEYAGRSFAATLTRTAGAIDPGSGTILVQLEAPNPDHALKPGSYAQASFPLGGVAGTVALPPSALIVGSGGTQVAVIGRDGKAQLRTVTLGRDQGKTVEIAAGLSAQDQVIDNPPDSLQSGDAVKVLSNAAK
ncbi:efflux RND transporter periplasmic adaptor subunit [Sphingomonas sp. RB3P16]|uniref:efflux RND transporter periplasmic adaptor subunit n=1 Tax=Parasphingomonas frigoris TaxID=3096163 RepID=UPI002FC8738C